MEVIIHIENKKMRDFDTNMWDIVELRYKVPKIMIDGTFQPKEKSLQMEEERKKLLLTSKVKWIIINSLTLNEYECISNCIVSKKVQDTLEVAHIGTT